MSTVTIEEAQAQLPQLLARLSPGQEIQIVDRGRPIARLIGEAAPSRPPRQPGSAIGQLIIVKEDDEHLRDFQEYMP
jgi:antitoxin (DNA-binding transcriptional repressor) of toxin-antitoxin stability system